MPFVRPYSLAHFSRKCEHMTRLDSPPTPDIDTDTDTRGAPDPTPTLHRRRNWRNNYARRLIVTDALSLLWAIVGSAVTVVDLGDPLAMPSGGPDVSYFAVCTTIIISWMLLLVAVGSRDYRKIGTGTAEYKAILQSGILMLVLISLTTFLFQVQFSRALVILSIPAGLIALLASRLLWRQWLSFQRRDGRYSARVLIVGSPTSAGTIAEELVRHPEAGYHVVGACVSYGVETATLPGTSIPVLGSVSHLLQAVQEAGADTVLVVGGHNLSPAQMRSLSWSLEPGRQHLVVAPSLTDIAGPRIRSRPVAGLPLIHVETPRYEGLDRVLKRGFDIGVSTALLLVAAIPLISVAIIIATTSKGGIFFSHERIGKRGVPFRMLKFRSMSADADARLAGLLALQGSSDKPLFKIENDPRITPIGRFIRRYSIDEIPQLINVLRGDMSLVGPRPQVAKEVALYDNAASRRLFVRPGMTGLWQVSGRSNLTWEESVRLDLYYVENWSLLADLVILARTARAVVMSDGAV